MAVPFEAGTRSSNPASSGGESGELPTIVSCSGPLGSPHEHMGCWSFENAATPHHILGGGQELGFPRATAEKTRRGTRVTPSYSPTRMLNSTAERSGFQRASGGKRKNMRYLPWRQPRMFV